MDGHDADNSKQSTADMTVFVQNLLQQMQTRFQTMSESIIGSPSPSAPLKAKDETKSAEDS
ncbi:hypothetical protein ACJIZ3_014148 [Penstemon smallii]|uniref:Heat shock factor binding protein n=1 Tax=Penstemon smallii TaxID=265156 RepID=A0ABD3RUE6_9LAMI